MKNIKQIWYRTGFKWFNWILQGVLLSILLLCLSNGFYWMEGSFSLSELGKSFEETSVFFQQVEQTVRQKIESDENRELFEVGGVYDENQEVDIRQYASGTRDPASLNLNLTYRIKDLMDFYQNGLSQMEEVIQDLMDSQKSDYEIGGQLFSQSADLETVMPVSGSSLADYARMNVTPPLALLEYYQMLCITSRDIFRRYQEYTAALEYPVGEENSEAPSNIGYYVENTATRQRYTNLGVKSFSAAQRMVENREDLSFLYEGERRFNIMVANSEYVMNEEASDWFIGARFLGTGEKVLIAVDLSYPIGDGLQDLHRAFEKREPILVASLIIGICCILLLIFLIVTAIATTGRKGPDKEALLSGFDRIPTEISVGLSLIGGIILYFAADWLDGQLGLSYYAGLYTGLNIRLLILVAEYWIFLACFLSLVRRNKAQTLWSNSVCYAVILGCRQVYSARRNSKRLVLGYIIFFALNIFFLGFFGFAGVVMAVVIDMAVLLYLMRSEVGKQSVWEGLNQLSQGELSYKIDTRLLTGESLAMAQAVNEMGDGLQSAVDSMLKNERLKAELITNVSHDIKTPLTSIINYVDLLKREELNNPKASEYLKVLEQKSQRLRQLTEDLIEASKISTGNIELHPQKLNLSQMLQQAYGEFAERLEERKLEAVLKLEKEPLLVEADGRQLWRIFENLLGNIVKYAQEDTKVVLELKKTDQAAEIIFQNTSGQRIQVSAQDLQERFVRGDLSRNTEGSGLGLSIAKSLTEMMKGRFEVTLEGDSFQAKLQFPLAEVPEL